MEVIQLIFLQGSYRTSLNDNCTLESVELLLSTPCLFSIQSFPYQMSSLPPKTAIEHKTLPDSFLSKLMHFPDRASKVLNESFKMIQKVIGSIQNFHATLTRVPTILKTQRPSCNAQHFRQKNTSERTNRTNITDIWRPHGTSDWKMKQKYN